MVLVLLVMLILLLIGGSDGSMCEVMAMVVLITWVVLATVSVPMS